MKMNRARMIAFVTLAMCVFGVGCYVRVRPRPLVTVEAAPPPPPAPVVVYDAPPPPPAEVEVVPVAPYPGMIWIGGAWFRGPRGWEWHRGYWRYR